MKASIRKTLSVSDLQISFKPISITFKHPKRQLYKLYLQKNVQIIGQIKQIINSQPKLPTYVFAYDIQPIIFRKMGQKIVNYQISLYQFNDGVENYIESVQFVLDKFIADYFKEFLKSEDQLTLQMIGKKQSNFADIWNTAKNNITHKVYNNTIKFIKTDAVVEFTCTPHSQYDRLVKLNYLSGEKQKNKKAELTKSKTMPEKLFDPKSHFLTNNYGGSQIIPPNLYKFDPNKKGPSTENKYQMQIKIAGSQKLSSIDQVQQKSNLPDFLTKRQKAVTFDFENPKKKENIFISQEIDQQIYDPTDLPQIAIKNYRDIRNPQIINSQSKLGHLSLSSQMNKSIYMQDNPSRIREYLGRSCELGIYLFVIIVLMHPISKVG